MTRRFNITGSCNPERHYMVRLDSRLEKIKENFVDYGSYFVINRGRQYGKTTTLRALEEYLRENYIVLSLDFQQLGTRDFADEETFAKAFADVALRAFRIIGLKDEEEFLQPLAEFTKKRAERNLKELFFSLSEMCVKAPKPIVMMIDEVDSASNNQVFVDFLAQLRMYYLNRDKTPIFHSVIFAGVYDIKNLKLKLRPEVEHQYNSPWNTRESNEGNECLRSFNDCQWDQIAQVQFDIAADFDIDMSFSALQIAEMLEEYEADNQTGMDTDAVAGEIYQYTSGYPYLVSAICKIMDEKLPDKNIFAQNSDIWTKKGVEESVKVLLRLKTTLFDSMVKHIHEYPNLKEMLYAMLFQGGTGYIQPV